jgi:hypothetical protein
MEGTQAEGKGRKRKKKSKKERVKYCGVIVPCGSC